MRPAAPGSRGRPAARRSPRAAALRPRRAEDVLKNRTCARSAKILTHVPGITQADRGSDPPPTRLRPASDPGPTLLRPGSDPAPTRVRPVSDLAIVAYDRA